MSASKVTVPGKRKPVFCVPRSRRHRMLQQLHDQRIQEEISIARALVDQHGMRYHDALIEADRILARRGG